MFGCFLFLIRVIPNQNSHTSLCSARDMSSWNHTQTCCFFRKQFNRNGLTGQIFPSLPCCYISLISIQKRHSSVGSFLQSSWCMMYHQKQYNIYFFTEKWSNWSISACTWYHLDVSDPVDTCLAKNTLSFDFSISPLIYISDLWFPYLSLIGFLRGTHTTSSCYLSYSLSWTLLPLPLESSTL